MVHGGQLIKTALIGYGNWGRIIKPKLEKVSNLLAIYRSEDEYVDKINNFDWVIIATPDCTHYNLVKMCLSKKINVFCEKPLTLNHKDALELFEIAKHNQVKLFIDEIEIFKNLKINFKKKNIICRKKFGGGKVKDILYRLTYHDLYLIHDFVFDKKIKKLHLIDNIETLNFKLFFDECEFHFQYDLNFPNKIHFINDTDFNIKKDTIEVMFNNLFNNKVSFKLNQSRSLFCLKVIDYLNNNISFN